MPLRSLIGGFIFLACGATILLRRRQDKLTIVMEVCMFLGGLAVIEGYH